MSHPKTLRAHKTPTLTGLPLPLLPLVVLGLALGASGCKKADPPPVPVTAGASKTPSTKKPLDKKWDPKGKTAPPAAKPPADSWIKFESKTGRFKAEFPSSPKSKTSTVPTAAGNLQQTTFSAQKGRDLYAIATVDYPKRVVALRPPAKMLDGARDGAIANVGGKLVKEQQLKLQGWPARRLRISVKRGRVSMLVDAVLCIAGNRLYQAMVARPPSSAAEKDVSRFLASFQPQAKK